MTIATTQTGPDYYEVSNGNRAVAVIRNRELAGRAKWVARAKWDDFLMTDPLTKAEAFHEARQMVSNHD